MTGLVKLSIQVLVETRMENCRLNLVPIVSGFRLIIIVLKHGLVWSYSCNDTLSTKSINRDIKNITV